MTHLQHSFWLELGACGNPYDLRRKGLPVTCLWCLANEEVPF